MAKLRITNRILLATAAALSAVSALAAEPNESGAGKVCGVLRSFEGETQVFDYTRTRLGDAAFGTKLHCGDWVSVDKGKATVELAVGAAFLVDENSFLQILDPQSGENSENAHIALYRGEFVAEAKKGEIRIVTPNAIARVSKGDAFVVYSGAAEESQLVGLGGVSSLENRFFPEPRMASAFGKVVSFANPVERLLPDQARFVSSRDLNERLARLGIPASVREALEKSVKAGTKTKMPVSLASTAKPGAKAVVHPGGEFAGRAPASVVEPAAKPAAKSRKIASRKKVVPSDEPDFALKRRSEDEIEKKKLLQALATMRPDSD